MLNWTSLCGLVMLLAGPFSGFAAARDHKAGIAVFILFTVAGLVIAVGIAMASNKIAYSVLRAKSFPVRPRLFVYMLVSAAFLFAVLLVPHLLAKLVYG